MVSLFSQLSVMTHSARSAPNIAYRCYLLNFEKPLGKLRSWAWFQAFLCRLGAHQVVCLKSRLIIFIALMDDAQRLPSAVFERSSSPNRTAAFLNRGHLSFYTLVMKITELLPHHTRSVFRRSSFSGGKASHPSLERKMFCILRVPRAAFLECKIKNTNSQCLAFFFSFFFFFSPPFK